MSDDGGAAPGDGGPPPGRGASRGGQPAGDTPKGAGKQTGQQGIAAAITEVSERASLLIREEIELAKTEIAEKTTRLAKGAIVAIVAGVFFLTALFFILIGCAWLLYYELPIGNEFTYFWGFFAMAVILVVLGILAGLVAARAVKAGSPPTPDMAIEEARKIRETVSSSSEEPVYPPSPIPVPPPAGESVAAGKTGTDGSGKGQSPAGGNFGKGTGDGTTLGS